MLVSVWELDRSDYAAKSSPLGKMTEMFVNEEKGEENQVSAREREGRNKRDSSLRNRHFILNTFLRSNIN